MEKFKRLTGLRGPLWRAVGLWRKRGWARLPFFPTAWISLPETTIKSARDTLFLWLEVFSWKWKWFLKLQEQRYLGTSDEPELESNSHSQLVLHNIWRLFTLIFFRGAVCSHVGSLRVTPFCLHRGDTALHRSLENAHSAEGTNSISDDHGHQSSNSRFGNGTVHISLRWWQKKKSYLMVHLLFIMACDDLQKRWEKAVLPHFGKE